jgi:hypothetical protein
MSYPCSASGQRGCSSVGVLEGADLAIWGYAQAGCGFESPDQPRRCFSRVFQAFQANLFASKPPES